jgi:rod shape-determining protein MreC
MPEMAVISPNGVVGIVESVSEHYASVISVLNRNFRMSAKFKKNNYFGSFEWPGVKYLSGSLKEIPLHVNVQKGDTIISSGYSAIFPEGVLVGFVDEFEQKGGNFYKINLKLATDFKNLNYVYIVANNFKNKQRELEKTIRND